MLMDVINQNSIYYVRIKFHQPTLQKGIYINSYPFLRKGKVIMTEQVLFRMYVSDNHLLVFSNNIDTDKHNHLFCHLFICLEKSPEEKLNLQVNNTDIFCRGIILDGRTDHTFRSNNGYHALILVDHTSLLGRNLKRHYLSGKSPYFILPDSLTSLLAQQLLSIPDSELTPQAYQDVWHQILSLLGLAHCATHHAMTDRRIINILAHMKSSNEFQPSIKELAEKISLSSSRLSHIFSQQTDSTLKSYLLFKQLLKALSLIADGYSVTDAALDAGFDSPSHLSATCRRLMGIQPSIANQVSVFLKVSLFH